MEVIPWPMDGPIEGIQDVWMPFKHFGPSQTQECTGQLRLHPFFVQTHATKFLDFLGVDLMRLGHVVCVVIFVKLARISIGNQLAPFEANRAFKLLSDSVRI